MAKRSVEKDFCDLGEPARECVNKGGGCKKCGKTACYYHGLQLTWRGVRIGVLCRPCADVVIPGLDYGDRLVPGGYR